MKSIKAKQLPSFNKQSTQKSIEVNKSVDGFRMQALSENQDLIQQGALEKKQRTISAKGPRDHLG